MRLKDIQFAKYFLTHEINLQKDDVSNDLNTEVYIRKSGTENTVSFINNVITVNNPVSISSFLFRVLETIINKHIPEASAQNLSNIAILHMCREYVNKNNSSGNKTDIPVFLSFDKLIIPSLIIREIIEPITKKIDVERVLFVPCKCTDVCRIVNDSSHLKSEYGYSASLIHNDNYPLILCNNSVYNNVAQHCHIVVKVLELAFGEDTKDRVIKNLLLDNDELLSHLLTILKTVYEYDDVIYFMTLLESHVPSVDTEEHNKMIKNQSIVISKDSYLDQNIKLSQSQTPDVSRQWTQWSMLMGLIEKQLEPSRGSMWPTSELVKPHEDKLRLVIKQRAKDKNKSQLNFEELLDASRDMYDHNAIEPGVLTEVLLKRNRVWK